MKLTTLIRDALQAGLVTQNQAAELLGKVSAVKCAIGAADRGSHAMQFDGTQYVVLHRSTMDELRKQASTIDEVVT